MPNNAYQEAQSNYLGPAWKAYLAFLNKADRFAPQGKGIGSTLGSALPGRPGDEDSARTLAANLAIGELLDTRDPRLAVNAPLDAVEAQLRGLRGKMSTDRAMAIANDPRTSAGGAPIVGQDGTYATGAPMPQPVNRQAIAAQMAPGLVAPPPPDKPVTFGKPEPVKVGGKTVLAQQGSDGLLYGMDRKPLPADQVTPPDDKAAKTVYEWANVGGENKLLTPDEIRAQGGVKPMTATEALDERKYKKADPVLRGISELSEKINTQQGLLAKMGGGAAKLAAKANYDDDVAEYTALVSGFTPMVARALGHTGVLTQQDVDSVKALFPLPGDSKTLRDRKMARVLGIIGDLESATSEPARPVAPVTGSAPPAADKGTIEMVDPQGNVLDVPMADVDKLLALGARRKQ